MTDDVDDVAPDQEIVDPQEARRLLALLVGLANEDHLVRGIGTRAIARAARIRDHRTLPTIALQLETRGEIAFYRGSARNAHSYRVRAFVREETWRNCRRLARARLGEAFRFLRAPANERNAR